MYLLTMCPRHSKGSVQAAVIIETLCDSMDCSPSGSSVHEIFQARILKWVAISYSRGLPYPGIEPVSLVSPALAGRFFTTVPSEKPIKEFIRVIKIF